MQQTDENMGRLASIGQISAGIAHEVRNPLTAVKGFLQLLKEDSQQHEYVDIALSELDNALNTLNNLLQVSRADLVDEPFVHMNLCTEIESIISLFKDQMYRITVDKHFLNTDIDILGQKNALKKAFFNLLKNAFEAIPDKGKITITHQRQGSNIVVSISDTGVGIPEEKLKLLGTPFLQRKSPGQAWV